VSTKLVMGTNGTGRRNRSWPEALKREIVAASYAPGSSVSKVARHYDVNANQVFGWRKRYRDDELRLVLAEVQDVPRALLPWNKVRFDRSNRHWGSLLALAKLFLRRQWQATHHDANLSGSKGTTLLFPTNDLFEAYVAVLLKRAVEPLGFEVTVQGGLRYCLEELDNDDLPGRALFRTRPDIIVRSGRQAVLILDTKWKHIVSDIVDAKRGVSQSDVYQLMAYAQLYNCPRLLLLYPHHRELVGCGGVIARHRVRLDGFDERLAIASVELSVPKGEIVNALRGLVVSQLR
jgi:5-methylcytosine-specific restriction enzyme subunit McrC